MVYGVYINPEADWKMLITAQLEDIKRTGVFEASKLYVVVTNPFDTPGVREFFLGLDLDLHELSIHTENRFEYPAIKKVYDLSLSLGGNALIAYFHSKGMSYANNKRRSKQEIVLTHYTFRKWRMVVDLFSKNRELSMAGLALSLPL